MLKRSDTLQMTSTNKSLSNRERYVILRMYLQTPLMIPETGGTM